MLSQKVGIPVHLFESKWIWKDLKIRTCPMNHLESPPNLSLSLRKFWSCNQLRRKLMIEGVLIILWLIYLKSLKSNECQIGFWTFLRKCMRLINISSCTQPWTQAVRRVLAFLESHTWTFFANHFNQIRQWSIQWFCWLQYEIMIHLPAMQPLMSYLVLIRLSGKNTFKHKLNL